MVNIDKIVDILYTELDDIDKEQLSKSQKDFTNKYGLEYHMTAGMDIRNRFGLWEYGDADYLSSLILHRLICKVKGENYD